VAYNKGPYMIVDAKDFKTMGKKIWEHWWC
jgi:hypothetical protein